MVFILLSFSAYIFNSNTIFKITAEYETPFCKLFLVLGQASLNFKYLAKLSKDKHSSLKRLFISDEEKKVQYHR
jgi:hypothetical protein